MCTAEAMLKLIESRTGLSFSYNTGLLDRKRIMTLEAHPGKLVDVLRQIFNDPDLSFSIIGRHIVVYRSQRVLSVNPYTQADSVYFVEIRGRVLDRNNRDPLPYTSIYLEGKGIGTVSNDNGEFLLKLNSAYLADTLSISCIGYKNIREPVPSLIGKAQDLLMKPDVVSIQEVIIRKINPVNLLQSAIDAMSDNYSQKPVRLTSFYRELVKKGVRYMMVSEAILENYKTGYNQYAPGDQVRILKGRKSQDFSAKDTIMLKLKAGLSTMLRLDLLKYIPDFLKGEDLDSYEYKLADIVVDNGREQYAIEFRPRPGSKDTYYSGRILLDVRNLAITWIDFYIDPQNLDIATQNFILRKPPNVKAKVLQANYKTAFKVLGNKYYLHLVQCEIEFRIKDKRQFTGSVFNTSLEMVVTDVDTLNAERFKFKDTAKPHEFFADQLTEYDESFWGEYNFIRPEESLEDALIKLSRIQAEKKNSKE